jgi:hypothetical protein
MANDYKDPNQSEIGKWLTGFFGLAFLSDVGIGAGSDMYFIYASKGLLANNHL